MDHIGKVLRSSYANSEPHHPLYTLQFFPGFLTKQENRKLRLRTI
ncbi:hypothetical protein [Emcibacter nanhaiensis]|nr:hypothetical protein [Emcibacter nanhaiensis]